MAAICYRPDLENNRLSFGEYYLRQQAYVQAIAVFEALVELDTNSAKGRYGLGVAYEQTGRVDAALRAYRLAVDHWRGMPLSLQQ